MSAVASRAVPRSGTSGAASALSSPRAVTRGESTGRGVRAKVDWLHATFQKPAMSIEGFVAFLGSLFGRPISADACGGLFGFEQSVKLIAHVGSRKGPIGAIAWGGEHQLGRWMLQLTGHGCGLLEDWEGMQEFLEGLDAKLTRVDLAVDFLDGEHTVDDAVKMYECGGFGSGGRQPSTSCAGDWIGKKDGRTLYVGKSKNGKMLRVYEKGIQMGDFGSEWVRYEVQFGSRDRVLPFAILTDSDRFFAGAYPALADLIEDAAERIETVQKGGTVTLSHLLFHLKRCYGKVLDVVMGTKDSSVAELVEEVRIVGIPRRLQPSSLAAGLTWAQVLAQLRK